MTLCMCLCVLPQVYAALVRNVDGMNPGGGMVSTFGAEQVTSLAEAGGVEKCCCALGPSSWFGRGTPASACGRRTGKGAGRGRALDFWVVLPKDEGRCCAYKNECSGTFQNERKKYCELHEESKCTVAARKLSEEVGLALQKLGYDPEGTLWNSYYKRYGSRLNSGGDAVPLGWIREALADESEKAAKKLREWLSGEGDGKLANEQKGLVQQLMAVDGFLPMLSSGFGDDDPNKEGYKPWNAGRKMLASAAAKWNAYTFHGEDLPHNTGFGKLMTNSGIVSDCDCDRVSCDRGTVAGKMWSSLSKMFVDSFPTTDGKTTFLAAIHYPASNFKDSIMFNDELPAVTSDSHGIFLVANTKKDTRERLATCAEYSQLIDARVDWGFSYDCYDCDDARMEKCEKYT